MREAYRLQKHTMLPFLQQDNRVLEMMIIYISPVILSYSEIEKKMTQLLHHVCTAVEKDPG